MEKIKTIYITTLANQSLQEVLKEDFFTQIAPLYLKTSQSSLNPTQMLQSLKVVTLPLQEIHYLSPKLDLESYGGLIFTSKNAILALSKTPQWLKIPCFILSQASAKLAQKLGGRVEFIGSSGNAREFCGELVKALSALSGEASRLLWACGERVAYPLDKELSKAGLRVDRVVCYKSSPLKLECDIKPHSFVIFTAPSMLGAYRDSGLSSQIQPISIGPSTKEAFREYKEFPTPLLSPKPSVLHSLEFVLKLRKNTKI